MYGLYVCTRARVQSECAQPTEIGLELHVKWSNGRSQRGTRTLNVVADRKEHETFKAKHTLCAHFLIVSPTRTFAPFKSDLVACTPTNFNKKQQNKING